MNIEELLKFKKLPKKDQLTDEVLSALFIKYKGLLKERERDKAFWESTHENIERAYAKIDKLVEERTAELQKEVTERKGAEEELTKYREHLEEMVKERTKELEEKTKTLGKARESLALLLEDVNESRAELDIANKQLQLEIAERKLAEEGEHVAKDAAETASRAKSDFLASMSHELRTPLNAIIGFSEVLQEQYFGELNEKQADYVKDIFESGKHLLDLINDILDLSKIEAGKMELEPSNVNIKALLETAITMIKEKCLKHDIALGIDIPGELEEFEISADERKLKQVMFNLLSNAAKFTPDGGSVRISTRVISDFDSIVSQLGEKAKELTSAIEISVADTGIGIASDKQENIFKEFYQVSSTLTGKTSGTGLGLPITRRIVEMHGGIIRVESEGEGKGSRFVFMLPIIEDNE